MAGKICKEYEGEWKISTPAYPSVFKPIVTPCFSPLQDDNIKFCFESWYQRIDNYKTHLDLFKLKLVKLSSICISPTLEVTIRVEVNYSDDTSFTDYDELSFCNVGNMKDITFNDVIKDASSNTNHYDRMNSDTLVLKCKMTFHDNHQTSHFKVGVKMLSLNKYCDLMKNFKTMYGSSDSMFSDLVFKVGDKTLAAHKVVLSAHSPVFQKMLTHNCLEYETGNVTITDATPEIFDTFLRYLYSGEIENKSWDTLKELYFLADKYDVGILKNECVDVAISILSVDLICDILKVAYTYSDSCLKTAAKHFAIQHLKEIYLKEDWKDLETSHPMIGYEITTEFISKQI